MILCVSHSQDFYTIDKVMERLAERGIPALRLNSDLFPGDIRFVYEQQPDGQQSMRLQGAGIDFDTRSVRAVWWRKIWSPSILKQVDPSFVNGAAAECNMGRQLLYWALKGIPNINDYETEMWLSSNKFLQAQIAQSVGLCIPHSIYTSDPAAVRQLYAQHPNGIICKLHDALSFSMTGGVPHLYTTIVTEEMMEQLDSLEYAPMIFQERIHKAYELRIAYINGHCFAGKIPPVKNMPGMDDWRNSAGFEWQPYELPEEEQAKLRLFMQKAGLLFGAIDVIRSTDGRYVFLEVNPSGEWGMVQKFLNYPIAETIADTLIQLAQYDSK